MPNWCDNRLAIVGPPKVVMALVEELSGPEGELDFEQLLTTPSELLGGADYKAPRIPPSLPGWYAWRREHWGVKWNASDVTRIGYGRTGRVRYRFLTPWGPPLEFFDYLAIRYPDVLIRLVFEVEFLGDGSATWRQGRQVAYEELGPFGLVVPDP